ncbi:tail fiber assembly protein [Scandinavium goeteborgense]|uniref:tail fiber assembly protein n=1 Tax=Scandinavium goeteborgense TaxID=1851514 RepID=UPI002165E477|nr:tail fiber assembly protein [Scandinavium goeteborgense]MCS2153857.1 tail fiber assembly protein [Scandinavium goeteborgense]
MQNIKSFRKAKPTEKQRTLFKSDDGSIPVFLTSEDGMDWYESHKLFADDTIKIMYDNEGIIRSLVDAPVPQRGNIYAVSMFFPEGMSVAEVAIENYPEGCCIDGTWKFDGESIYQDMNILKGNYLRKNISRHKVLAGKAATAITIFNSSSAVGNPRVGDADNLLIAQQYLDALRDVDLTSKSPAWPPVPDFIL